MTMKDNEVGFGGYGAVEGRGGASEGSWEDTIPNDPTTTASTKKKYGLAAVALAVLALTALVGMRLGSSPEELLSSTPMEFEVATGSGCPYAKHMLGMAKQKQLPSPPSEADVAMLGPLAALVGKWEGNEGLSVVSLPKANSKPDDKGGFELVVRPFKEVITIAALSDPVRNRGGYIEQYSGVVTYYKEVVATDDDPGTIHVENGMFFYLSNITKYGTAGEPAEKHPAPYSVARSATIPHGNVAFLFGSHKTSEKGPKIKNIDSRAPNSGTKEGSGYNDQFLESPYEFAQNPNGLLKKSNVGQNIIETTHLSLDSKNDGSVTNTPFITANADTTGFKADIWIEKVMEPDGSITEQLQYSEFADILFHRKQIKHPGKELISWPHVNVNTLKKVEGATQQE